ncbi:MAG: type II toxin-antitoxin system PemK/MazF family toxin [Acidimicrobiia bacterium]
MDRGEIYLAPFTYADLQGSKRRPVCVVSAATFNAGPDVIVAMVTSSAGRLAAPGIGDVVLADWRPAGLLRASVVRTGRLLVLETRLLSAQLGTLTAADLAAVDQGLKGILGLP